MPEHEINLSAISRTKKPWIHRLSGRIQGIQDLLDNKTLPTRPHPWLIQERFIVLNAEQTVENACITPITLRTTNKPFFQIRKPGLKCPDEKSPFQKMYIVVDRMVRNAEALTNLRGIPQLAMNGRYHFQQTLHHLRFGAQSPDW